MDKTQLQALQEANQLYREISRITELIVHSKALEQLPLIQKRGEIITTVTSVLKNLKSLPIGGTLSAISKEKKILDENIMAVVAQDNINEETIGTEKDSVEKQLNISISRHRVSHAYKLNSRDDE